MPRTKPTPAVSEAPRHPRWASPREGAAYANVGLRTITGLVAEGKLPGYRFGKKLIRINLDDVDRLMIPVTSAAVADELTGADDAGNGGGDRDVP